MATGSPLFKRPSIASVILGAVLTSVTVLNVTVFHLGLPWSIGIATLIPVAAAFGIAPITGAAFQALIDLTPAESTAVASALAAAQLVVLEVSLETTWRAVLTGVIAVAATLGFGPQVVGVVKHARAQARAARVAKWSS